LQNTFDLLIDSYINSKVGIAEDFLTKDLAYNLSQNLQALYSDHQLHSAGIGNNSIIDQNKLIRSDIIYWLDRNHNNEHENSFFDLIDAFVLHLNTTCYTGITGYEFHYALYEKGSFYKKHLDQFRNNESRQFSLVMYLNENWQEIDGGELCIHHLDNIQNISPNNCKGVFFKSSEMEHEVLLTTQPRLSITGWLKN
jgi:SM-20-related protein